MKCAACKSKLGGKRSKVYQDEYYCNDNCLIRGLYHQGVVKNVYVKLNDNELEVAKEETLKKIVDSENHWLDSETTLKDGTRIFYNRKPVLGKREYSEGFHEHLTILIPQKERCVRLTLSLIGKDDYGDRVFTEAYYTKYLRDETKNVPRPYYKYDVYKDTIEEAVQFYINNVMPDFNPRKIDAIGFASGFNDYINKKSNDGETKTYYAD